jgi:hypothetical protein
MLTDCAGRLAATADLIRIMVTGMKAVKRAFGVILILLPAAV